MHIYSNTEFRLFSKFTTQSGVEYSQNILYVDYRNQNAKLLLELNEAMESIKDQMQSPLSTLTAMFDFDKAVALFTRDIFEFKDRKTKIERFHKGIIEKAFGKKILKYSNEMGFIVVSDVNLMEKIKSEIGIIFKGYNKELIEYIESLEDKHTDISDLLSKILV